MDKYLYNWYMDKYQETQDPNYKKAADTLAAKANPPKKPEGVSRFLVQETE